MSAAATCGLFAMFSVGKLADAVSYCNRFDPANLSFSRYTSGASPLLPMVNTTVIMYRKQLADPAFSTSSTALKAEDSQATRQST